MSFNHLKGGGRIGSEIGPLWKFSWVQKLCVRGYHDKILKGADFWSYAPPFLLEHFQFDSDPRLKKIVCLQTDVHAFRKGILSSFFLSNMRRFIMYFERKETEQRVNVRSGCSKCHTSLLAVYEKRTNSRTLPRLTNPGNSITKTAYFYYLSLTNQIFTMPTETAEKELA